jgi:hypothetical protein
MGNGSGFWNSPGCLIKWLVICKFLKCLPLGVPPERRKHFIDKDCLAEGKLKPAW